MLFTEKIFPGAKGSVLAFALVLSAGAVGAQNMESLRAGEAADIFNSASVMSPETGARPDLLRPSAEAQPGATSSPAKDVRAQWTMSGFKSALGGINIAYKSRMAPGARTTTVFAGGLALAESFESLFYALPPDSNQFFMWYRGLPPSSWVYGRNYFEADARDLARFINISAERSGAARVTLVLHSYATLVVQKLVQLRGDAEVDRALGYLRGSRVLMLNPTTHYKGSEAAAGPEYAQTAQIMSNFTKWLDTMDDIGLAWQGATGLNPFLQVPVDANMAVWKVQRENALRLTSEQARRMMADHLSQPWDAALEGVRKALLATVRKNMDSPQWQEALLRRTNDTANIDVSPGDIEAIRASGIKLEFVHANADQLIPWKAERLTAAYFGIKAPEQLPRPGAMFYDMSGLFSLRVVAGDHYFPLKIPAELNALIK